MSWLGIVFVNAKSLSHLFDGFTYRFLVFILIYCFYFPLVFFGYNYTLFYHLVSFSGT